jgi:HAD superfamily hydrolase (TIGR01484 family)
MIKLIVFDLDGTLAESKSPLDEEMAILLGTLLKIVPVAVISGGDWPQFQLQLLSGLSPGEDLRSLFLLPTCGTKYYSYDDGWKQEYSQKFEDKEKQKITNSLRKAVELSGLRPARSWGETIEDRGSQITYSALGQQAPLEEKKRWDPDVSKRMAIKSFLDGLIPEFTVRLGGTTSIDITQLGVDKAFGIRKLSELLSVGLKDMVFVGDALFPGGNDYPVKEAGVLSIQVENPQESKLVIETLIACLGNERSVPECEPHHAERGALRTALW